MRSMGTARVGARRSWQHVDVSGVSEDPAVHFTAESGAAATGLVLQPDAPRSLVEIAAALRGPVAIAVGPEGGFDEDEFAVARRAGYQFARLGPRVLRTETAGLAALAAIQGTVGDFA